MFVLNFVLKSGALEGAVVVSCKDSRSAPFTYRRAAPYSQEDSTQATPISLLAPCMAAFKGRLGE